MQAIGEPGSGAAVRLFGRLAQVSARLAAQVAPEVERATALSTRAHELLALLGCPSSRALQLSQLADSLRMSPSGLSRLTDRMEQEGLVVRRNCSGDHRGMNLVLTAAGAARLKSADRVRSEVLAQIFPSLAEADMTAMAAVLDRLAGELQPSS